MKVHAIQTGEVQIKSRHKQARREARPARALDVMLDPKWSPRLPIQSWLIEHPEGLILVDTGESSHANDPGYQPWWHPFMRTCERRWVAREEEIDARIRALGLDASDVRWVVMTHMHGDHAGGMRHFPKAKFVMSATEAAAALARTGPLQGYLNNHYPTWLDPQRIVFEGSRWESFDQSFALTKDGAVRLVPTPGHTLGHISVAVDRGDDVVLVAGDAAYDEAALVAGIVDGVAQSAAAHRDSTRRIRELTGRRRTVLQCAHDPMSTERLNRSSATTVGVAETVS